MTPKDKSMTREITTQWLESRGCILWSFDDMVCATAYDNSLIIAEKPTCGDWVWTCPDGYKPRLRVRATTKETTP